MSNSKWQPVLMILRNGGRLECECGALAVIVIGELESQAKSNTVENVDYWCKECYFKAIEEMEA